jgi:hypothetical protein
MTTAATPAAQATTTAAATTTEEGKSKTATTVAAASESAASDAAVKAAADEAAAEKTAADATAADEKAAAAKAAESAAGKTGTTQAPDKYELQLPEGSEAWLEAADLKEIETVAKAEGWTNEQAQDRLDQHATMMVARSAAFRVATEADPIYGGEHLAETERHATLALDRLRPAGTPQGDALRKLLVKTGFGNNIEVVSFLSDIGKRMAEDVPIGGGGGGRDKGDTTKKLYDHPTSVALSKDA